MHQKTPSIMDTNYASSSSRKVRRNGSSSSTHYLRSTGGNSARTLSPQNSPKKKFPPAFTQRWGSHIDQDVVLDTNDGNRWFITVEWRNGNIWLGDGWRRFKHTYNIQILDTMYFKYEEKNHFSVLMFNPAGIQFGWDRHPRTHLPISFCKHIVHRDYSTKLVLPDDFTMAYGPELQHPLTIIAADGLEWQVEWEYIEGSLWLTKGWAEISINYNLKYNDFLFFTLLNMGNMLLGLVPTNSGLIEKFQRIGIDDTVDTDVTLRELWTSELSQAVANKTLPLYVPASAVYKCLANRPEYVSVVLPSGVVQEWKLLWSPGRPDECYIGNGWYDFKRDHNLQAGQVLKFSRRGSENQIILSME